MTQALAARIIQPSCGLRRMNTKQQMPRQMIGRWSLQHALPPCAQTFEIETAQMGDLVLYRCLGRDTTIATLLPSACALLRECEVGGR
jgi:hypothetical protein